MMTDNRGSALGRASNVHVEEDVREEENNDFGEEPA